MIIIVIKKIINGNCDNEYGVKIADKNKNVQYLLLDDRGSIFTAPIITMSMRSLFNDQQHGIVSKSNKIELFDMITKALNLDPSQCEMYELE